MIELPYELIGRMVIGLLGVIVAVLGIALLAFAALFIWVRGWTRLSNRMYRGYETHPKEERPPLWRMRIAAFCTGMANFQFHKIPAGIRESKKLTDDHTTLLEHFRGDD